MLQTNENWWSNTSLNNGKEKEDNIFNTGLNNCILLQTLNLNSYEQSKNSFSPPKILLASHWSSIYKYIKLVLQCTTSNLPLNMKSNWPFKDKTDGINYLQSTIVTWHISLNWRTKMKYGSSALQPVQEHPNNSREM